MVGMKGNRYFSLQGDFFQYFRMKLLSICVKSELIIEF